VRRERVALNSSSTGSGPFDRTVIVTAIPPVDTDGDGTPDADDVCPTIADNQQDSDGDGIGNACDNDPLVINWRYSDGATQRTITFGDEVTLIADLSGDWGPYSGQFKGLMGTGLGFVLNAGQISSANADLDIESFGATQPNRVQITYVPEVATQGFENVQLRVTGAGGRTTTVSVQLRVNDVVPPNVAVPNVVGQTEASARSILTTAGLVVGSVTEAFSATVPAGSIVATNPEAGTFIPRGASVNLVKSKGQALATVPNFVGLTRTQAQNAITGAGLNVGSVTEQHSSAVPAGQVISSNPTSGTSVPVGSVVNLVVSLGVSPVVVPNVVGQTEASARSILTSAGLNVGSVTEQHSSTIPAGSIIATNPTSGTSVPVGSTINLVRSKGPEPVDEELSATLSLRTAERTFPAYTNIPVRVTITGGVPPYQVIARQLGGLPAGNFPVQAPGAVDFVIYVTTAATGSLDLRVTDSAGTSVRAYSEEITVTP